MFKIRTKQFEVIPFLWLAMEFWYDLSYFCIVVIILKLINGVSAPFLSYLHLEIIKRIVSFHSPEAAERR